MEDFKERGQFFSFLLFFCRDKHSWKGPAPVDLGIVCELAAILG